MPEHIEAGPPVGASPPAEGWSTNAEDYFDQRAMVRENLREHAVALGLDEPAPPVDLSTPAVGHRYTAACNEVHGLADGSREWTMRIPRRPERDSDLVISAALEDIPRLLAERDRLAAQVADVRAVLDTVPSVDGVRHHGPFSAEYEGALAVEGLVKRLRAALDTTQDGTPTAVAEPQPGTYFERAVLRRFATGRPVDLDTVRQQIGALLAAMPAPTTQDGDTDHA